MKNEAGLSIEKAAEWQPFFLLEWLGNVLCEMTLSPSQQLSCIITQAAPSGTVQALELKRSHRMSL